MLKFHGTLLHCHPCQYLQQKHFMFIRHEFQPKIYKRYEIRDPS